MEKTSFIEDYFCMVQNTKPAYVYQVWSMLSTLSVFAGRRMWFPFGPKRYYPHLYTILVGDPGNGKSSAMERSMDIVRESGVVPLSGTRITKEALMERMSNEKSKGRKLFVYDGQQVEWNAYAIYATEIVDFLGAEPQGFLDFLTAAWDQSVVQNETKHQGNNLIVGPYVTLFGCMTPEKLKGMMKLSILTGGFARRCAFVYSADRHIINWPSFTKEQAEAKARCIEFGRRVQALSGPFTWTQEVTEMYNAWNENNERTLTDKPMTVRGWFDSKGEMLWKLSMLAALGSTERLHIEAPHYRMALRWCEMLEKTLERVFEGSGINPNSTAMSQICRMVEAMKVPIPEKKLLALFWDQVTDGRALQDTISHLCLVGRLKKVDVNVDGKFLGTLIGTDQSLANCSMVSLAALLSAPVRLPGSDTDSSQTENPPEPPASQHGS